MEESRDNTEEPVYNEEEEEDQEGRLEEDDPRQDIKTFSV